MVICVSSWSRLRAMEAGRSLPVSSLYLPLTVAVSSSYACSHWSLTDSSPCCLPTMSSNRDLTSVWNSRSMSSVQNDGRSKPPATSVTWPDPMVSSCLASSVASGLSASVPAIWVKYSSTSLMRWSFRRDPHAMRSWSWGAGPPSLAPPCAAHEHDHAHQGGRLSQRFHERVATGRRLSSCWVTDSSRS